MFSACTNEGESTRHSLTQKIFPPLCLSICDLPWCLFLFVDNPLPLMAKPINRGQDPVFWKQGVQSFFCLCFSCHRFFVFSCLAFYPVFSIQLYCRLCEFEYLTQLFAPIFKSHLFTGIFQTDGLYQKKKKKDHITFFFLIGTVFLSLLLKVISLN